ncbi:hypothetical protein SAMN05421812_11675 [Asanoa hainanensis]|uniref:Tetratricopeptide repeat-containing protein n=1 Tax=Asanoa hainanensis TaxID=560556 RepID=A0A239PAE0_9ACTN|nr:hypothetical protein [Asanoa hainanensis]SNT64030.1 hypothetical protein SAMN05421812_11675 [Asanoa hainanensis]
MRSDRVGRQLNVASGAGMVAAVQGGDLHVHQRIGTHFIDEMSFDVALPHSDEQPSRLLNAGNQVVDFTGRQREIADLTAWRDDAAAVAVRLVHGGAGQGKTRLAHRFAELSRAAGWVTLRARHSRDGTVRAIEVQQGNALATSGRVFVLVDYAERWPLSDLLALLLDRRLHGARSLRVLLLARPLGNWWHALTHRLAEALGVEADSAELDPVDATDDAYRVASACFARTLGVPDPSLPRPEVQGSVLSIHMAALAGVLAAKRGDTPPTTPADLSAYLLEREQSHWQYMYDNDRRVESTPRVMGRAAYLAALTRPLDYAAAVDALKATAVVDEAAAAGKVLDDHAMCYPPHDPTTMLEPLYPDRLAEDFVALQTPGHAVRGFRSDAWANTAFVALIADSVRNRATALPLLIETARRWPHLAERQILPLLHDRPGLVVQAGSAALAALAAAPYVPLRMLEAIESALPTDPTTDLHAGVAAITERIADELAGQSIDPLRVARLSQKLGWRLLDAGRVRDGIDLLGRALEAANRLAEADRAAHGALLEIALRSLGRAQVRSGDWEPAVAALSQAVALWSDPVAGVLPASADIASCLGDLSLALWRLGDRSSFRTRAEAIVRLRQLVRTGRHHRLTLIRVLIAQADQLRQDDRHDDSLGALDEAIALVREVAADPDAGLESEFALALIGRAKTLQSLGRSPDAARAAAGAVKIFRPLAAVDISYDRDLAHALQVEAEVAAGLERWPDAIDRQEQATAIYRRLARISVARHGVDLCRALLAFARLCRDAGVRAADAFAVLHEAVALLQVSLLDADARERLLVSAASIGADLLDAAGRTDDADALRRSRHWPDRPPQSARQPAARPLVPSAGQKEMARSVAGLTQYLAAARLARLPPADAAGVIAALRDVRLWWLEAILRSLDPARETAMLRLLVRYDAVVVDEITWRVVAKRLLTLPVADVAEILSHASVETAAAVLNYDHSREMATEVLKLLEHSVQIKRLIDYDPQELEHPFLRWRRSTPPSS